MLELKNIVKTYGSRDNTVRALDNVSLQFREHEFVAILGQSGCGKTTLLNIIGGLDQYTSGDLVINDVSTKKYHDKDWDEYRNHSIGFVFQSYNLIPHQTVLANVELALTLSGISPSERRRRAIKALRDVGLEKQIHKRPNQMSGGQMQRVAIARALVNDPDILLADEPTGALDTQTSVQIMNILKNISHDKLIIMVTHNPDLARRYANRIIRLQDGRVVGDTRPYHGGSEGLARVSEFLGGGAPTPKARQEKGKRRSMSFFTALGLSLNNLMTKKARTFLTSFAGSIGIIGIALILSVSTGVNNYINAVQRDALASYPISLQAETLDLSSIVESLMETKSENEEASHPLDKIYESAILANLMNSLNNAETNTNDLKSFKAYLESTDAFDQYLTAVQYTYDFDWTVLTKDSDGKIIKSDIMELMSTIYGSQSMELMNSYTSSSSTLSAMYSSFDVWEELLCNEDGTVNDIVKDRYDLIYGAWPTEANQVLLVVNENNEISDLSLYALGLRTGEEIKAGLKSMSSGETVDTENLRSWTYEEICNMTFRLYTPAELYRLNKDGVYEDKSKTEAGLEYLYTDSLSGIDITICGILRPNEDATSSSVSGAIGYTSGLTEYAIEKNRESLLLQKQLEDKETDVLTGLPFKPDTVTEHTDEEKETLVKEYLASLSDGELADLYVELMQEPDDAILEGMVDQAIAQQCPTVEAQRALALQTVVSQYGIDEATAQKYIDEMTDEEITASVREGIAEVCKQTYAQGVSAQLSAYTDSQKADMFRLMLANYTQEQYAGLFDDCYPAEYSESTYAENLTLLGYVDLDSPSGIHLYASTFEDKDEIADLITKYNDDQPEEKKISYTDYVALLMSSITTIIDAISYVLIAFVAISLVVSSIMIGIITYISVLERTKEIGILRAIGASKRDIRRVFNAETLIVGFTAGAIAIAASFGLIVLINKILFYYTGLSALKATLETGYAVILVLISMFLTFIAGLIPAGKAAKKNPVEALRTE